MQRRQQRWLAGALGPVLLSVPLLRFAWVQFAARANTPLSTTARTTNRFAPPAPRNRFERLIREAERCHLQAWQAVNEERYALEAWDPAAADAFHEAAWRQELLAADRSGKLRRARLLALEAAASAGTPDERYWAALLLAVLACEAGDHQAEIQETRVLARLAPHSWITRLCLRHVAGHASALRCSIPAEVTGVNRPHRVR